MKKQTAVRIRSAFVGVAWIGMMMAMYFATNVSREIPLVNVALFVTGFTLLLIATWIDIISLPQPIHQRRKRLIGIALLFSVAGVGAFLEFALFLRKESVLTLGEILFLVAAGGGRIGLPPLVQRDEAAPLSA